MALAALQHFSSNLSCQLSQRSKYQEKATGLRKNNKPNQTDIAVTSLLGSYTDIIFKLQAQVCNNIPLLQLVCVCVWGVVVVGTGVVGGTEQNLTGLVQKCTFF